MFTTRKAIDQDLEFLLTIDRMSCEREQYPWAHVEREPIIRIFVEDMKGFGFVAENEKKSIGAVMLRISNSSGPFYNKNLPEILQPILGSSTQFVDIFDIWIDPEYRRKHVATALKRALEEECVERGIEWIFTFQHPENIPAIRMNEKLGYKHIGNSPMYDDVVRVCFLKHISGN